MVYLCPKSWEDRVFSSVVKKAYEIDLERLDERYLSDNIVCYATSFNKAKIILLKEVDGFWNLKNGEELTYLNIPVIRRKSSDIVIFEGEEVNRSLIPDIIHERERKAKLEEILNNPNIKFCYIIKGNYYGPNHRGYTSYRDQAGIYPKIEAVNHAMSVREIRLEAIDVDEHNKMINAKISELKEKLIDTTSDQTEPPISSDNNQQPSTQQIISGVSEFEVGIKEFMSYKPVNVAEQLKSAFLDAISARFIALEIGTWQATIHPLKNSYKFVRDQSIFE